MSQLSCSLLPSFFSEKVILPPIKEAKNQIDFAFYQSGEDGEASPSLVGRVLHITKGLFLMIPVVNWVVFTVMNYFSMTVQGLFSHAIQEGDHRQVELFLNLGFDCNIKDADGVPLIIMATQRKQTELVRLFLEHGVDPNTVYNEVPLIHHLIRGGESKLAREVITRFGADATALDEQGRTILQVLYDNDYEQFIHFISEGVVHPNLMNGEEDTIIHHILLSRKEDAIGAILQLLDCGVDLNIRSSVTKQTPLWMGYQLYGDDVAIAFMNGGAVPEEQEDLNYERSNLFQLAWESKSSQKELLWATALKCGAKCPQNMDTLKANVCNDVRNLDGRKISELYDLQQGDDQEVFRKRIALLAAMDKAGWDTFSTAYQKRKEWGSDIWIGLLQEGVEPPQGFSMNNDTIMNEVFNYQGLCSELKESVLLKMQNFGWEVSRLAFEVQEFDAMLMLLKNGGKPPTNKSSQFAIISKVVASADKRELVPIMMDNDWNFQSYFDRAIRDNKYAGIRFAIEMGVEVSQFNWQTAKDEREYRSQVLGLGNLETIVPTVSLWCKEREFIKQLFENIENHNRSSRLEKINPLEIAIFMRSAYGAKQLMKENSFEVFSSMLVDVVSKYPHISIGWMWEDLMEIPSSHYANFASVQAGADALPELPYPVPIDILYSLFDRINFDDSNKPHYKDEEARKDNEIVYSKVRIREGLASIIRRITQNLPDAVAPNDLGRRREYYEDHRQHLEVVAYYLQLQWDDHGKPIPDPQNPGEFLREDLNSQDPIHGIKANVLIDLARTGKMCSGRWKEIFYQCRCRLSGEEEKQLSFTDQLRVLWGRERAFLLERLHNQGTHTRDNLMYHLKEARGIPGDKPRNLDHYGRYSNINSRDEAIRDFDGLGYSPSGVVKALMEHMSQNNQQGGDFRELMQDWMGDHLSQAFNKESFKEMVEAAQRENLLEKHLTYEQLEEFMRRFDTEYCLNRHSFGSYSQFLRAVRKSPFLAPLNFAVELPREKAFIEALEQPQKVAREKAEAFIASLLPEDKQVAYRGCIRKKNQAQERKRLMEQDLLARLEGADLNKYLRLRERGIQSNEEKVELNALLNRFAPNGYSDASKALEEAQKEYQTYIEEGRRNLQQMNQKEVLERFWPEGDMDEYDRLKEGVKAASAEMSDKRFKRYRELLDAEEMFYINDADKPELETLKNDLGTEYAQLQAKFEQAEQEFQTFLMPFCQKFGLRQPPRDGGRFLIEYYTPLVRASKSVMFKKELFINMASLITIKQDMTVEAFTQSEQFAKFSRELGSNFSALDIDHIKWRNLSDPEVKKWLATLFSEVVASVAPFHTKYYIEQYQKGHFSSIVRPSKGYEDVFQRTKGFNPLVLYQMLVSLGELKYKDSNIFRDDFSSIDV